MRYAIFSDIHSNLQALEAVLAAYRQEKIDRYFCVGDIVGYAANPIECIKAVEKTDAVIVAGNHDWASVDLTDIEYFNPVAKQAVLWTKTVLGEKEKTFLKNLPLVYKDETFFLVHGTLDNPEDFFYLSDTYSAIGTFNLMEKNLLFVGHTHIAGIFVESERRVSYLETEKLKLSSDKHYIVNVGSVGQPRDGNPKASFCIFDSDTSVVEIRRVDYDIKEAQKRIIDAGQPSYLADRLLIGR